MLSALGIAVLTVLAQGSATLAQEFHTSELCPPVVIGDFVTAVQTGPGPGDMYEPTATVRCVAGLTCAFNNVVGGIPTDVYEIEGGEQPSQVFSTNDQDGSRVHRGIVFDLPATPKVFVDATDTFSPPRLLLLESFDLGDVWSQSGTSVLQLSDGRFANTTYTETRRALRREAITVPFGGPFEAVVISASFEQIVNGAVITSDVTLWYSPGLCDPRQEIALSDGTFRRFELLDTNLVYTPEPSSPTLGAAAIVALSLLRSGRRKRSRGRCRAELPVDQDEFAPGLSGSSGYRQGREGSKTK